MCINLRGKLHLRTLWGLRDQTPLNIAGIIEQSHKSEQSILSLIVLKYKHKFVIFNYQILPLKDPPQSITIKLSDLILELTLKKVRSIIAIMHKSSSNGPKIRFFLTLCEIVCAQRRIAYSGCRVSKWRWQKRVEMV